MVTSVNQRYPSFCDGFTAQGSDCAQNCPVGPFPAHPCFSACDSMSPLIFDENMLVREYSTLDNVADAIKYYLGIGTNLWKTTKSCQKKYERGVNRDGVQTHYHAVDISPHFVRTIILAPGTTGMVKPGTLLTPWLDDRDPNNIHVSPNIFDITDDPTQAIAKIVSFAPCPCWLKEPINCPSDDPDAISVADDTETSMLHLPDMVERQEACACFGIHPRFACGGLPAA